jgi:hypothetical protein
LRGLPSARLVAAKKRRVGQKEEVCCESIAYFPFVDEPVASGSCIHLLGPNSFAEFTWAQPAVLQQQPTLSGNIRLLG